MRVRINQLAVCGLVLGLWGALPALSDTASESGPTDVDRRWIPSLAFEGGAAVQKMSSKVESRCLLGRPGMTGTTAAGITVVRPACRDPLNNFKDLDANGNPVDGVPGPAPLRPAVDDSEYVVTPVVSANLQLMTPRLDVVPGGPRVFVAGELITYWGQERDIAREGAPNGASFPPRQSAGQQRNSLNVTASGLFGLGSTTQSEVQTLGWGARAGLAFPFNFRERRLWLKPSFNWIQYEVKVEAITIAGLKDDGLLKGSQEVGNPAPFFPNEGAGDFNERGPGIRGITLLGNKKKTYNGIGPGLELEMETGRFGPIGVSIFFSLQAFRMLGDRSISISDSLSCDPPANPCRSGLQNDFTAITDVPISPPRIPPPPLPQVEDIISPAGPVPDAGVLYPFPTLDPDPLASALPFGPDTYEGSWDFEVDEWGYRGGVGIRLHWLGR